LLAKTKFAEKQNFGKKIQIELGDTKTEYLKTQNRKEEIEQKLKKLSAFSEKFEKENRIFENLQNENLILQQEIARNQENLKMITEKEKMLSEKEKNFQRSNKEKNIYLELSDIFGKKGLQARILEQEIPALKFEANKLLEQLSDGKMQLDFITQKAKKANDEIMETLDIKISDESNERRYELFSGGEAFRINFAIRVAISKLLANRSGAKLQFLIIDEGFGTQDIFGKNHLVETINKIKDDFEKIVVITHLQDLKDAFTTRVDVSKDENGSHLQLVI
jgi:exonuclease SbcC